VPPRGVKVIQSYSLCICYVYSTQLFRPSGHHPQLALLVSRARPAGG
jgi:hypothetical protein